MLTSFGAVFSDFLQYLKKPVWIKEELGFSWNYFIWVTILFMIVFTTSMMIFGPIASASGINDADHAMNDLIETMPKLGIAFFAVIFAPIAEEFVFRFPLKYRRPTILLFIGFILTATYFMWMGVPFVNTLQTVLVGLFFLTILILIVFFANDEKLAQLEVFVKSNFPVLFYSIVILFAIIHFTNFQGDSAKIYMMPILVFPQFVLGLILGYLRMRFGMWANIYIHALNNAIPMTILLLFPDMIGVIL